VQAARYISSFTMREKNLKAKKGIKGGGKIKGTPDVWSDVSRGSHRCAKSGGCTHTFILFGEKKAWGKRCGRRGTGKRGKTGHALLFSRKSRRGLFERGGQVKYREGRKRIQGRIGFEGEKKKHDALGGGGTTRMFR